MNAVVQVVDDEAFQVLGIPKAAGVLYRALLRAGGQLDMAEWQPAGMTTGGRTWAKRGLLERGLVEITTRRVGGHTREIVQLLEFDRSRMRAKVQRDLEARLKPALDALEHAHKGAGRA